MRTKLLKTFATLAMLVCSLTASAHDFKVGGIFYNIIYADDRIVEVTYQGDYYDSYDNEYSGNITIPSEVTYGGKTYSVEYIGGDAFLYCTNLTSITIPESVTEIGDYAFAYCESLTSINIPESVWYIGNAAFAYCSNLTSINIPESVEYIGESTFYNCTLNELVIHSAEFYENLVSDQGDLWVENLFVHNDVIGLYEYYWSSYYSNIESIENYTESTENELTLRYISNPSFEGGHYKCDNGTGNGDLNAPEGWQVTYTKADWGWKNFRPMSDDKGQDGNQYFEFWANTYHTLDLSQELKDLPAGTYVLSAAMRTERADQVTNQHIYAKVGDKTYTSATLGAPIGSAWNAVDAWQTLSVEFTLNSLSNVVIGATSTGGAGSKGWFQIDNFQLGLAVSSISLSKTSAAITGGETLHLSATVTPNNATNKTITWTSSNTNVATVNSNGKVTGVGPGTATITARAGSKTATCEVEVTISVNSLSLSQSSVEMSKNETLYLKAYINSNNAPDNMVTWSSSNTAVATVDSNGKVTAVDCGTATITAKAGDKTATCEVKVTIPVSSISLSKNSVVMSKNETLSLTATVTPNDATDKTVTWTSSKAAVATVDKNGKVTAVDYGKAFITAKAGNKTATCEVKVIIPVSSISLDKTTATIYDGETLSLTATISPNNATNQTVSWRSSDTNVATVDIDGNVTGVGYGTAIITAEAGNKTATCEVKVNIAVSSISLSLNSVEIGKNETLALTATVTPDNATDKTVTWTSSNTAVATVDNNGKVTGVDYGTAIITAKAGSKTATCEVKVNIPVSSISLSQNSISMSKNQTLSLTATVNPNNATDKTVTWTSSNTAVATVDSNGKVTAVGPGTATITAKAGNKTATCEVKVTIPVSSISLDKTTATIYNGETLSLTATVKPNNATNQTVTWTSSNTDVATVDSNGKVTGVGSGTAIITAKAGSKTATCEVKVTIPVSSISLSQSSVVMSKNETLALTATINPDNATDKMVTWSSSNSAVAAVDNNGNVTTKSVGVAIITAKAGEKTATCEVNIKGWELNYATGHLTVNDDFDGASPQDYPWNNVLGAVSSVEFGPLATMVGAQAFVNAIGMKEVVFSDNLKSIGVAAFKNCAGLKELDLGEVFVIGENAFENCDGLTSIVIPSSIRSIQNYVFADCDGLVDVTIPNSVTAIGEGAFSECDELPIVVIPNSVTNIASKAFVNCKELGKVTIGLQVGSIQDEAFFGCEKLETVINLSSLNIEKGSTEHGHVAYYANTVITEGLFLDFAKLELIVGESATLTATLISKEDYTIKWSTSNSAVATVSNGKVTAKSAGTATITATAGGETATCVVTVKKPIMADGEYYLYDVDTKKFLSRGEYEGTCATVDKYGIPFVWTIKECSLKFLDSNLHLFETDDSNIYTDNASTGFAFETTDGGYLLKSLKSDRYLTIVDGAHTLQVVSVTDDTSAATVWQPMTKEEHDDIIAGYVTENYSNVLKAAEIPIETDKFLNHVNTRVKTDKTNAIGTARFNGTKGRWTYTGVNGKGTYGVDYCQLSEATGYHTQTITGLEKGIYKVTMQGFERSGSWEHCEELAEQGYEITTATLIANGEEVNLKSWYSGKSHECNPNNTKEAVAKFAEGEYMNEVYTYVGKDGTLTLTVNMPSRVDGSWLVFNNFTLTHYSSKKDSGVESSVLEAQGSQPIYDLMGRRVEKAEKGIYIVNGKKVVIK